jgi:hypothetical protein
MVKVYQLTIGVVDHDGLGLTGLMDLLEDRDPSFKLLDSKEREVFWDDSSPLNSSRDSSKAILKLFQS